MRKDANHFKIKKFTELCGAYCIDTSKVPQAFDLLVFFSNKMHTFEIKDGKKVKSKQQLTEGEEICKAAVISTGNKYNIITCEWDVVQALGLGELMHPEEINKIQGLIIDLVTTTVKQDSQFSAKIKRRMNGAVKAHEQAIKTFFVIFCKKHDIVSINLTTSKFK